MLQSNLSTMATLGTEESGCCGEVAFMGRWGCYITIFQHVYFPKFMLTVSHNGNPMIYHNYIEMKIIHKKLE